VLLPGQQQALAFQTCDDNSNVTQTERDENRNSFSCSKQSVQRHKPQQFVRKSNSNKLKLTNADVHNFVVQQHNGHRCLMFWAQLKRLVLHWGDVWLISAKEKAKAND